MGFTFGTLHIVIWKNLGYSASSPSLFSILSSAICFDTFAISFAFLERIVRKDLYTIGSIIIHMVQNRDNLDLEIILVLLIGETHVRGIAKLLDESHSTILRKLNKLTSENIIDFKKEGKNKVFFIKKNLQARNYIFNAERYKLIRLIKRYPEVNIIISDILKRCNEKLIVLFGSYAKGTAKKDSDIDIYVQTRDKKIKEEIEYINSRIKVKIGDFNLDSLLIKEIIKNHVILKGVEDFYEKIRFFD